MCVTRLPRPLSRPVAFALLTVLATGPAAAGPLTVSSPPVLASGPSPFAACTVGGPGTLYVNAEVEPRIAVNPMNPDNLVAVWQQDRWSNGGAHGLVTGASFDGGQTWSRTWAHFSLCSGGTAANGGNYDRASDPWVSFAPNGHAYQISLSASANLFTSAILVSKSTTGGHTWSEPITLARDDSFFHFNDKESITADSTDPQLVYAVWDRSRFPSENADFNALHSAAFRGDIIFSRTTNAGASWEPARAILGPNNNEFTIGNQIVVLPDGTLVDVFNLLKGSGHQPVQSGQTFVAVIRSTDKGLTWSQPIIVDFDFSVPVRDPDTGAPVRTGEGLPDIAVDPDTGALYVAWTDGRFSGFTHDDIALSKSTDGGLTWSPAVKVNATPAGVAAFTPTVRVAADGTVAVTYYDFRNNTPDPGLPTDYWIVHSHDGGETWAEDHIAGSFDLQTAPVARGLFLGDYQGLTSVGDVCVPFFIQTNSGNTANRTDAFAVTAGP